VDARFGAAVAEDLATLAQLQRQELDAETLRLLRSFDLDDLLALGLRGEAAAQAMSLLRQGIEAMPRDLDAETLDLLAVEYADIYLNNSLGVSPCESVWLDEDGLVMQEPMFRIRDWYRRYGLAVPNWRERSDDHLVHQLQFLSFLFAEAKDAEALRNAGRFMDGHLLRWVQGFAQKVSQRCQTPLYAGLVLLMAAYIDELRDLIEEGTGLCRPEARVLGEQADSPTQPSRVEPPATSLPGVAPGW
jgi:TorA maturation chaperone TorD